MYIIVSGLFILISISMRFTQGRCAILVNLPSEVDHHVKCWKSTTVNAFITVTNKILHVQSTIARINDKCKKHGTSCRFVTTLVIVETSSFSSHLYKYNKNIVHNSPPPLLKLSYYCGNKVKLLT